MAAHNYWVFIVALSITVAIPGPGIFAVTSCALGRGLRDAIGVSCGIVLGDWTFLLLAAVGMTALAHSMGELFLIIRYASAAYLVWIGVKLWRASVEPTEATTSVATNRDGFVRHVIAGTSLTLGNPKAIGFYAGLLPTVIDLQTLSVSNVATLMLLIALIVVGICSVYAYAAARARAVLSRPDRLQLMNRVAGTVMIGTGFAVVVR